MLDKYVIPRKIVSEKYASSIAFVEGMIQEGYYISTYMDQFFRKDINQFGYHHPNYIYGFDTKAKETYIMDNFEQGKFQQKIISYDEFIESYNQIEGTNWEASIFLYKLKQKDFFFTPEFVREQILDYLHPENQFCYFNRMECPKAEIDNEERYNYVDFGINCYEFLQKIISKNISGGLSPDIRFFCILEDHKYLMVKRYEYMSEKELIRKSEDIHKGLQELLAEFQVMTNLYLKYMMTARTVILKDLIERLSSLKERDILLMNQFCEAII